MTRKRIFITGATGCIGHYVTDALMRETDHELYLLVRNPSRLRLSTGIRPGITVLQGDLQNIGQFAGLLKTMHLTVLAAADWGGTQAYFVNVAKTLELLDLLDPVVCEQAVYFSTSSIVDRNNQPLEEAGEIGTDYIRSKYDCFQRLPHLAIAPRITTLFPTLVVGGDAHSPRSFLSDGLPTVMKWMNVMRFFKAEASFHLIHGHDIAQVVRYLIEHPPAGTAPRSFVLGQPPLTLDQAVDEVCAYLGKKIYLRIPVPIPLARVLLMLSQRGIPYRDRLWDRFCLHHRDFTHANPVNPASFGLPNLYPTLTDVLQAAGIPRGASPSPLRGIPQVDGSEDRPR